MVHKHITRIARTLAASTLLALAAHVQAQPSVVWVDNENFGFTNCAGRHDEAAADRAETPDDGYLAPPSATDAPMAPPPAGLDSSAGSTDAPADDASDAPDEPIEYAPQAPPPPADAAPEPPA